MDMIERRRRIDHAYLLRQEARLRAAFWAMKARQESEGLAAMAAACYMSGTTTGVLPNG